jgi:hypothetical protein
MDKNAAGVFMEQNGHSWLNFHSNDLSHELEVYPGTSVMDPDQTSESFVSWAHIFS